LLRFSASPFLTSESHSMRLRLVLPALVLAFTSALCQATSAPPAKPIRKPAAKAAPGGGRGLVWVNSKSNVYRYYGKTKDGKYMTEAAARAMGAHGSRNHTCHT